MARGTTLAQITNQLRAELGVSTNPGQNLNSLPYWQQVLRRTQERLYAEYAWEFLKIDRDESLLAGQRYYTFNADVNYDTITQAWVKYAERWVPIDYGISPALYNLDDSDEDKRNQPVLRWKHYEGNQFEVWPIPSANLNQVIRFACTKQLAPLIANEDRADLDDTLIVLFAAAEILERTGSADAKSKAALANQHYLSLRRNADKTPAGKMGGECPPANSHVSSPPPGVWYPRYGGYLP